jgi:TRAP-type C4-dicarboxylate transport system substrate-binding protein
LLALVVGAAPKGKTTLKCATVAPDGSTWVNLLRKMSRETYLKTKGRVTFKFFAGGIAGEEKSVLDKMRYGQLQAAALSELGMGMVVPEIRVLEVPFAVRTYEEYDAVVEKLLPGFESVMRKKGFELIGWGEAGFANFWSKKPIHSLDDLRGTKVWLRTGDPLVAQALKDLGVTPVPLPLSDVLTSLQTGLIDTVYVSPLAVVALQWFPHLKYRLDVPWRNISAGMMVDKRVFDAMSEADQKAVRAVSTKYLRRLVRQTRYDNKEAEKVLESKGIKTTLLGAADRKKLDGLGRKTANALVDRLWSQETLDGFYRHLEEARAKPAKPAK